MAAMSDTLLIRKDTSFAMDVRRGDRMRAGDVVDDRFLLEKRVGSGGMGTV